MTPPLKTELTIGFYVENWVYDDLERLPLHVTLFGWPLHNSCRRTRARALQRCVVGAVQSRRQPHCVVPPPLPASTMDSTAMADRHEVSGLLYGEISDAVALVGHSSLHRRRCEESCTARLRRVVRLAEGRLLAAGAEDPCNLHAGGGPDTSGQRVVRRECRERLPAKTTWGRVVPCFYIITLS